jgi:hypothetical protein
MDNADVFDLAARRYGYGRRLARERMSETAAVEGFNGIAAVAEELIASAQAHTPRLPPIHFDYIYQGAVNAFAFRERDRCLRRWIWLMTGWGIVHRDAVPRVGIGAWDVGVVLRESGWVRCP